MPGRSAQDRYAAGAFIRHYRKIGFVKLGRQYSFPGIYGESEKR
jgi:hypothetical protein